MDMRGVTDEVARQMLMIVLKLVGWGIFIGAAIAVPVMLILF